MPRTLPMKTPGRRDDLGELLTNWKSVGLALVRSRPGSRVRKRGLWELAAVFEETPESPEPAHLRVVALEAERRE